MNNFIITGIPRSGTSLFTSLISKESKTLCFSEPIWLKDIRSSSTCCQSFSENLENKFNLLRKDISQNKPINLTLKKGSLELPENYYKRINDKEINLKNNVSCRLPKHYSNYDFFVKSNTQFTACLKQLKLRGFKNIYCIIRDPIAVLMSWRSLNIPISRGSIKIGELYSKEIRKIVTEKHLLIKQVKILDWFFKQYYINDSNIIKYEELISKPKEVFANSLNMEYKNPVQLKSQNTNAAYNLDDIDLLSDAISKHGVYMKKFYKL